MTSQQITVNPRQGQLPGPPLTILAREYANGQAIPFHRHERGQLIYAVSGVMELATADALWLIPPQRALWMPPQTGHRLLAKGAVSLRTVFVHPDATPAHFPRVPEAITVTPLLRELILRAHGLGALSPRNEHEEQVEKLILLEINGAGETPLYLPMGRDARLARICSAILGNPAENRTLQEWGQNVGASPRTLARLFRAETGLSFQQWQQQAKVLIAIPMLVSSVPVTAIAFELGYETPAAFSALFRRIMGVRPSQYPGKLSHPA